MDSSTNMSRYRLLAHLVDLGANTKITDTVELNKRHCNVLLQFDAKYNKVVLYTVQEGFVLFFYTNVANISIT